MCPQSASGMAGANEKYLEEKGRSEFVNMEFEEIVLYRAVTCRQFGTMIALVVWPNLTG